MPMSGGRISAGHIGVVARLALVVRWGSGLTGLVVVSAMTAVAEKVKRDKRYAQ
jgi:hypothetical protein